MPIDALIDRLEEKAREKEQEINEKYHKKMKPYLEEIEKLKAKLEPLEDQLKKELLAVNEWRKEEFGIRLKSFLGESYPVFSEFIEKVKRKEIKDDKEDLDEEQIEWIRKASLEEYLRDSFESEGIEFTIELLKRNIKLFRSEKKKKEIVFAIWKLEPSDYYC